MITIAPEVAESSELSTGTASLVRFIRRACAAIPLTGKVSILLTTDDELRRLNRMYRKKDKPTDVLSFPAEPVPGLPTAHQQAGDVAISLERAAEQAADHGHSLPDELRILLLHGLLHLAGFDHEADQGQMAAREIALRSQLGLRSALIERSLKTRVASRQESKARSLIVGTNHRPASTLTDATAKLQTSKPRGSGRERRTRRRDKS